MENTSKLYKIIFEKEEINNGNNSFGDEKIKNEYKEYEEIIKLVYEENSKVKVHYFYKTDYSGRLYG